MKSARRVVSLAVPIAILSIALCFFIGIIGVNAALHPARLPVDRAGEDAARNIAVRDDAALADVSLSAADGATLRGWLFKLPQRDGDAVILLHGQGDNRAGMLGNADMLLRHGYSVLLPDARAHGESGGAIATYGVMESDDTRRWFEWLKNSLARHCIDGLGDSMGAAILLESLATEPQFCAVVAESSFATFREASYDRIGQWFGTGPWLGRTLLRPAVDAGFLYADIRYDIDFWRASPEEAVARTRVPVLLIHGLADDNLPPRHSERIREANPAVVLWEPPGAGHCGAAAAAPAEYERRVVGWLGAHQPPTNPPQVPI
jgi:uncharacterized protein